MSLTDAGCRVVAQITEARRREIRTILQAMPIRSWTPLLAALRGFADAVGEVPEQSWSLRWGTGAPDPAPRTLDMMGSQP